MTDATIYQKDGKTLGNPLLVHVEGPLVVRGLLGVDEDRLVPNREPVGLSHIDIAS